jgi:hypothetical protein
VQNYAVDRIRQEYLMLFENSYNYDNVLIVEYEPKIDQFDDDVVFE